MEVIKEGYHRISDILKPFTGVEFVDPEKLEYAGERGTRVHAYIEEILRGEWVPNMFDPVSKPYIDSFNCFWEGSSHLFKDCKMVLEQRFYCDQLMITGKIDALFHKSGRTYLIDWKTSSSFHNHWHIQGAAYQYLAKVNGFHNPDEVLFVHLKKNKKPTTYKDNDSKKSLEIFLKCLDLYNFFGMKHNRKNHATTIREY